MDEETNETPSQIASNVEPVDAREEVANAGNHYLVARPAVPVPEDELSPEEERRRSRVGNGTAADARRNVDRGRTANVHGERKGLTRDEAQAPVARPPRRRATPRGETNADGGRRRRRLSPSSNVGFNWRPSKPPSRRRRRRGPSSSDTSAPGFDPRPRRAPFRSRSPYPWTRERRLRTRGIITSSRDRRCPCRRMNSRRRRNGGARASGTESPRTRDETSTEDGPRTRTRQPPPRRDARGRRCPRDTSASTTVRREHPSAPSDVPKDRRLSKTSTRSRTRTILRRTPRATSTSTISRGRRVWRRKRRRRAGSRRWRRRDRGAIRGVRATRAGRDRSNSPRGTSARVRARRVQLRAADAAAAGLVATDAGVAAGLRESSGDSPDKPPRKTLDCVASPRGSEATPRSNLRESAPPRQAPEVYALTQTRARARRRKARARMLLGGTPRGAGSERGRRDRDGEIRVGGCHPGLEVRLSRLARRLAERGAIVSGCRLGCHLGCRLGCHLARRGASRVRREGAGAASAFAPADGEEGTDVDGADADGGEYEYADGEEMVATFSTNALEQILRDVASRGGLDDLLEGGEGEGGEGDVTAEDVAKIIALVKAQRRERAESSKTNAKRDSEENSRRRSWARARRMRNWARTPRRFRRRNARREKTRAKRSRGKRWRTFGPNSKGRGRGRDGDGAKTMEEKEEENTSGSVSMSSPTAPSTGPPPPPPPPPWGSASGSASAAPRRRGENFPACPPPRRRRRLAGSFPERPPPPPPPPPGGKLPGRPRRLLLHRLAESFRERPAASSSTASGESFRERRRRRHRLPAESFSAPPPPPPPPGGKIPGAPPPPPPPPGGQRA